MLAYAYTHTLLARPLSCPVKKSLKVHYSYDCRALSEDVEEDWEPCGPPEKCEWFRSVTYAKTSYHSSREEASGNLMGGKVANIKRIVEAQESSVFVHKKSNVEKKHQNDSVIDSSI